MSAEPSVNSTSINTNINVIFYSDKKINTDKTQTLIQPRCPWRWSNQTQTVTFSLSHLQHVRKQSYSSSSSTRRFLHETEKRIQKARTLLSSRSPPLHLSRLPALQLDKKHLEAKIKEQFCSSVHKTRTFLMFVRCLKACSLPAADNTDLTKPVYLTLNKPGKLQVIQPKLFALNKSQV